MKIGIMGGTFDPIHNGHLMIAEHAYRQFELDEVWFLPNGNPPHKNKPQLAEEIEARVAMTKLAIEDIPYFKLNTYECERKEKSYTYHTIKHFREEYPDAHFYFIMGADSLLQMEVWRYPEQIISQVTILATFRDEMDTLEEMNDLISYLNRKYHGDIRLLEAPLMDVSSSAIRQAIEEGREDNLMIPEKVLAYIRKYNIYDKES